MPGAQFTVELSDGEQGAGTVNDSGRGKIKLEQVSPAGRATATWECGVQDFVDYSCEG